MPLRSLAVLGAAVMLTVAPAGAQHRRDQDDAYAARRAGQVMSLHQIERRIVPQMAGADYLGPEFDAGSGVYRLKFMRAGRVTWIDVDGRSGAVVGRSGH